MEESALMREDEDPDKIVQSVLFGGREGNREKVGGAG